MTDNIVEPAWGRNPWDGWLRALESLEVAELWRVARINLLAGLGELLTGKDELEALAAISRAEDAIEEIGRRVG